jgi:ribosomal protein L34
LRTESHVGHQLVGAIGGFVRAFGQPAHFARHYREAAALLARSCRFHGGVECEQLGLARHLSHKHHERSDLLGRGREHGQLFRIRSQLGRKIVECRSARLELIETLLGELAQLRLARALYARVLQYAGGASGDPAHILVRGGRLVHQNGGLLSN